MNQQEILAEVNKVFIRVFEDPAIVVTPATVARDVPRWDSLNHTILIARVQEHFKVKFSLREVMKLQNVGDMCVLLEKKLAG